MGPESTGAGVERRRVGASFLHHEPLPHRRLRPAVRLPLRGAGPPRGLGGLALLPPVRRAHPSSAGCSTTRPATGRSACRTRRRSGAATSTERWCWRRSSRRASGTPHADRRAGRRAQRAGPRARRAVAPRAAPPGRVHRGRGRGRRRVRAAARLRPRAAPSSARWRAGCWPRASPRCGSSGPRARGRGRDRPRPPDARAPASRGRSRSSTGPGDGAGGSVDEEQIAAPAGRDDRGLAQLVDAAPALRGPVARPGAPERPRPAGPHLPADRRHRRRADHLAARGGRAAAATGTTATPGSATRASRSRRSGWRPAPTRRSSSSISSRRRAAGSSRTRATSRSCSASAASAT